MRNLVIILALFGAINLGFGPTDQQTAVVGTVRPSDGAEIVWLIGARDSASSGLSSGQFYIKSGPGVYKLVVIAKPPYHDVLLENLVLKENETLDVGEIILTQTQ